MTDHFSNKKRSAVMAAVISHGNKSTELKFINLLRQNSISGWRRKLSLMEILISCFQKTILLFLLMVAFGMDVRIVIDDLSLTRLIGITKSDAIKREINW